tara:strand:+ start:87 stop:305 length:219 start_codon:yes stop_codon:yes gene_type:complete
MEHTRNVYILRYEDGDIEFCAFYQNQRLAMKGRSEFKRQFGKVGSVERKSVPYSKKGFIDLFNKYAVKYRQR